MSEKSQQVSVLHQTLLPFSPRSEEDTESTSECFPAPNPASSSAETSGEHAPTEGQMSRWLTDISPEGISFTLGLDLGFSTTGFALYAEPESRILAWGSMDHTNRNQKGGVPERMESRARLRSARRERIWNRPARFNNRKGAPVSHGKTLHPTMRSHLAAHLKLIRFLRKRYDIDAIVVEGGQFDTHALKKGGSLKWWEYQRGPLYGYENAKAFVRDRDNYTCAYCGARSGVMTVDHILPQSRYPMCRNHLGNMVCACKACNTSKGSQTAEEFGFPEIQEKVANRNQKGLRAATGMNYLNCTLIDWLVRGKLYVEEEQQQEPWKVPIGVTYGFVTKRDRRAIGWPKTHRHDAAAIATDGENARLPKHYIAMRWMGRPQRQKCKEQKQKSGVLPRVTKRDSITVDGTTFRRGDYVEYRGRNRTERGFVNALRSDGRLNICSLGGKRIVTPSPKNVMKLANQPRLRYEMRKNP